MTYMKGDNNMPTVLPKENEVEQFFSRIMASEGACERLMQARAVLLRKCRSSLNALD